MDPWGIVILAIFFLAGCATGYVFSVETAQRKWKWAQKECDKAQRIQNETVAFAQDILRHNQKMRDIQDGKHVLTEEENALRDAVLRMLRTNAGATIDDLVQLAASSRSGKVT